MTNWQHVSDPSEARQQMFSAYQHGHLIPDMNAYQTARSQSRGLRDDIETHMPEFNKFKCAVD
jgi:hypothetical protein